MGKMNKTELLGKNRPANSL